MEIPKCWACQVFNVSHREALIRFCYEIANRVYPDRGAGSR